MMESPALSGLLCFITMYTTLIVLQFLYVKAVAVYEGKGKNE